MKNWLNTIQEYGRQVFTYQGASIDRKKCADMLGTEKQSNFHSNRIYIALRNVYPFAKIYEHTPSNQIFYIYILLLFCLYYFLLFFCAFKKCCCVFVSLHHRSNFCFFFFCVLLLNEHNLFFFFGIYFSAFKRRRVSQWYGVLNWDINLIISFYLFVVESFFSFIIILVANRKICCKHLEWIVCKTYSSQLHNL